MSKSRSRIAVLGLWHLGEIYSAGLAELGHEVIGIDANREVVRNLARGVPPLAEPGLAARIKKNHAKGRLSYSSDIKDVAGSDVVWLTFDTPVNDRDESDLALMMAALKKAIPYLKNNVLVVVSSQIPVGTSKTVRDVIKKTRPRLKFQYVYAPENLRLGEALDNFLRPERIVAGAESDDAFRQFANIVRGLKAPIVKMSPQSAEVAKHALNAFLATSISFANDIADVCECAGADVVEVMKALRSDPRIGERAALNAGLGFSGGTLGRDLVSLMNYARKNGITAPVVENVFKKNAGRPTKIVERLAALVGGLKGKHITVYGLTYKPGTTTLRRSRSLQLVALLAKRGARLTLCDPRVSQEAIPVFRGVVAAHDVYSAAQGAHALVFATPWPDFKTLHFAKLARRARKGAIVFDAWNFLYPEEALIKKVGFKYHGIGR